MITPTDCYNAFGEPSASNKCMVLWDVPKELEVGIIPKRIYCNRALIAPATEAFRKLVDTGAINDLLTYDGCFNIRKMRRSNSTSLHSWGLAMDFDAFRNPMGKRGAMTDRVVECFTSSGWDWGGEWRGNRIDPMHFQLRGI